MSSIFLSHNHEDKQFVRRLGNDLHVAGVRVWIDEAEILIGDSLVSKIEDAIDDMEYLGVVLSPNSVKSTWVTHEVRMALDDEISQQRVKVLPILLADCDLPGFLRNKLYADFRDESKYEASLHQMLRRLTESPGSSAAAGSQTDVPTVHPPASEDWLRGLVSGLAKGALVSVILTLGLFVALSNTFPEHPLSVHDVASLFLVICMGSSAGIWIFRSLRQRSLKTDREGAE
ncbi:MAG: toll/interleukin-1 receptor domain-containing protein [Pseudomonadota bacterium]